MAEDLKQEANGFNEMIDYLKNLKQHTHVRSMQVGAALRDCERKFTEKMEEYERMGRNS